MSIMHDEGNLSIGYESEFYNQLSCGSNFCSNMKTIIKNLV